MSRIKRGLALLLAVFLAAATGLSAAQVKAEGMQQISGDNLSHFNIELVIDGSGSLTNGNATDPTGIRYDAIRLFLALLTNEGNSVGAIVFNGYRDNPLLMTELTEIKGKAEKVALADAIEAAGARGDTDIGGALLNAVDKLIEKKSSGRQSVIILFSDGRTDLENSGGDKAYEQSITNKEEAIVKAQEEGIPVFTICLAASPVADPAELQEIADRTYGKAVTVSRPEELANAFEEFYALIFSAAEGERVDKTFPENGELVVDVPVPSYGAEEVNIILDSPEKVEKTVISPSGQWEPREAEDASMGGGQYDVLKLVAPEGGNWQVALHGRPGSVATVNVVYNINSSAQIRTADGKEDYEAGESVTIEASLVQNGSVVTDSSVTRDYATFLTLRNLTKGTTETKKMDAAGNGTFSYTIADGGYDSYEAEAVIEMEGGGISLKTDAIQLHFGNTAPVALKTGETIKATVTPVSGKSKKVDLTGYFKDAQDSTLTYSIEASQLVKDTYDLNGAELTVNTGKSKSGEVVIRATDSQGAYAETTIYFKVTNLTLAIFLGIVGAILAVIIAAVVGYMVGRPVFKGQFTVSSMTMGGGIPRGDFRGTVKLSQFPVAGCGLDVKNCYFKACRGNALEFHTKDKNKPFYVNEMPMTSVRLFPDENLIYADENETNGIVVDVQPRF